MSFKHPDLPSGLNPTPRLYLWLAMAVSFLALLGLIGMFGVVSNGY